MIEAYENYIKKVVSRFQVAMQFLWVDELTGKKILEIETSISEKPSIPNGFWGKWPGSPTSIPLYMWAGDSALHVAAKWPDAIYGAIACGRLRVLKRQPQFCKDLTEPQAKAWIEASITEANNHTDMSCRPIDRFREVELLRRKIDAEYAQFKEQGGNEAKIPSMTIAENRINLSSLDTLVSNIKNRRLPAVEQCEIEIQLLLGQGVVDESWKLEELAKKLARATKTVIKTPTWISWRAKF